MQDKTINNALLALRKQIIREGGEGLDHVEALLALRGVDMPRVLPAKRSDVARRGQARQVIIDALRASPMSLRDLSVRVAQVRPELTPKTAYKRTSVTLAKLKEMGWVDRDGPVWRLAP
ncbi:hypothetical protein [Pseudooceanicola sp.]|uniref:hypothetical protein n=1 Tax=Pseudooceanicola sp. TaxID=1914328 RepID=UPI0035C6DCFB